MKINLKFIKNNLIVLFGLFTLISVAHAAERKDCRLHVVASTMNSAKTALVYTEAKNVSVKGDTTKGLCLDNEKIKKSVCDDLKRSCETTMTALGPAGVASGWVQWGISREDCPFRCPEFNATNLPDGFHNFAQDYPSKK